MIRNFLLLISFVALTFANAPFAKAYTNAEIAAKGKAYRTIFSAWDLSNNGGAVPYLCEGDIDVSLDPSTGYIKLAVSFDNTKIGWSDPITMLIDVKDKTATIKYNAYVQPIGTGETETINRVTYRKAVRQWFQMVTSRTVGSTTYYVGLIPRTFSYPTQNDTAGKQMTGTVSYDEKTDTYTIDFGKFDLVYVHLVSNNAMAYYYDTNNDGSTNGTRYTYGNQNGLNYYNRDQVSRHQGMSFTFYTPNATVTDTKYNYNGISKTGATNRSYTANVSFDGEEFNIINWNNSGAPWYVDVENNQFVAEKNNFSVYFEADALYTEVNPMEFGYGFTSTNVETLYANLYGTNFDPNTYLIEGVPCRIDADILHNSRNTNGWLDGNTRTSLLKIKAIDVDSYDIIQNPLFSNAGMKYINAIDNTVINLNTPLEIDYTHSVSINKNEFGYGQISDDDQEKYLYLNVNLQNFKNTKFIKEYELYAVPGKFSNPNYQANEFTADTDKGHIDGTRIDLPKYHSWFTPSDKDRVRTRDFDAEDYDSYIYNLRIPEKDLVQSPSHEYSLYVKAIYTEESNLTPTFHALTALGNTTTGVENIIDNGENVENAPAVYYNLNGVQMNSDALTPGIYIRRQGNTTEKVVIR